LTKLTDIESNIVAIVDSGPTNATRCRNMKFLETKMAADQLKKITNAAKTRPNEKISI